MEEDNINQRTNNKISEEYKICELIESGNFSKVYKGKT